MKPHRAIVPGLLALVLVPGCASTAVQSTRAAPGAVAAAGVPYFLPMGRVRIDIRLGYVQVDDDTIGFGGLDAFILDPQVAADPEARYTLTYRPGVMSDDQLCFAIGPNGALSSVQFAAADRTGDVIQRLAETAAVVAGLPGGDLGDPFKLNVAGKLKVVYEDQPFVTLAFNPDSAEEIDGARVALRNALLARLAEVRADPALAKARLPEDFKFKNFRFVEEERREITDNTLNLLRFEAAGAAPTTAVAPAKVGGVVFRMSTPRRISVKPAGGVEREAVVMLPDPSTTAWLPVDRARFVRKTTSLTLKDGALVAYEVNKPSEAYAVASLPLEVAGAVIETPARFFTSIGNSFRSQTGLLKARAELVKAEAELEKVKQGEAVQIAAGTDPKAAAKIGSTIAAPVSPQWALTCTKTAEGK